MNKSLLGISLVLTMFASQGCVAVVTTAAGVGGSAAVSHVSAGSAHHTFTAPASKVKLATVSALSRMKIKVVSDGMQDKSKIILMTAKTNGRAIEILLEPISANATMMKVSAKSSVFSYDNATAEEIVAQTKKSLG